MKRFLLLLLVLALLISGCSGGQTPTQPDQTAPPTVQAAPVPSEPLPVATNPVLETTVPEPPVSEPAEVTEPTVFSHYTIRVDDPSRLIYKEPGFHCEVSGSFQEAGVFTIVEETYDRDGNLWGRLKSGIGWVCLTEPPMAPIHADYASEHFVADYHWHCGETEYVTDIGILASKRITDLEIALLGFEPVYSVEEVLYSLEELEADGTLKISVVFWGDMTTYGVSFTDSNGNRRAYALMISGMDGSLICSEYPI